MLQDMLAATRIDNDFTAYPADIVMRPARDNEACQLGSINLTGQSLAFADLTLDGTLPTRNRSKRRRRVVHVESNRVVDAGDRLGGKRVEHLGAKLNPIRPGNRE